MDAPGDPTDLGEFVKATGKALREEATKATRAALFNTRATEELFANDAARAAEKAAAAKQARTAECATALQQPIVVYEHVHTYNKIDNRGKSSASSSPQPPPPLEVAASSSSPSLATPLAPKAPPAALAKPPPIAASTVPAAPPAAPAHESVAATALAMPPPLAASTVPADLPPVVEREAAPAATAPAKAPPAQLVELPPTREAQADRIIDVRLRPPANDDRVIDIRCREQEQRLPSNTTAAHAVWEATFNRLGIDQTARDEIYLLHDHSADGRARANDIVHKLHRKHVTYDDPSRFMHKSILNARSDMAKSWSSTSSRWSAAPWNADGSPESSSWWSAAHWNADGSPESSSWWSAAPWYADGSPAWWSRWAADNWDAWDDADGDRWTTATSYGSAEFEQSDLERAARLAGEAEYWRVLGWAWSRRRGWHFSDAW